jgi:hypothetical protein
MSNYVPPTIAQQVFVIGSGLAAGAAGLILAKSFVGKTEVRQDNLVMTTMLCGGATLLAAFLLAKSVEEPNL